jgi:hypothetical protein
MMTDLVRRFWWVLLLLFSGILGCSATIKTAEVSWDFQSKPPGIAAYKGTMPGLDVTFEVDPWLAVQKIIDGVDGLLKPIP